MSDMTSKKTGKQVKDRVGTRRQIIAHAVTWIVTLPVLYFFWYLIYNAFALNMENVSFISNWRFLWEDMKGYGTNVPFIWPILVQTLLFSACVTIIVIIVEIPAAYAFSRLHFPGRKLLMKILFFLNAFPSSTLIIGIYYVMISTKLVNTFIGVVLVKTVMCLPGQLYILKGFFDDVPWDYEWSALVDGCNRFTGFAQVVLPAVKDGIGVTAINAFLSSYGEWFFFRVLIYDARFTTLARTMSSLVQDGKIMDNGIMSAFALFYVIPIALIYLFSQKQLLKVSNLGGKKLV